MLTDSTPLGHLDLKRLAVPARFGDRRVRVPRKYMPKATRIRASRKAAKAVHASAPARNGAPARRKRGRPARAQRGARPLDAASLAQAQETLGLIKSKAGLDLTEKVKDLLRLAKEQGQLTYDDVNDALPDDIVTPEDLDKVLTKLRNLEIEIIDPAEVDRTRQP